MRARLLSVRQAAEYLGLSIWTVRALEGAGTLRRVRLALGGRDVRKLLFDREELDRVIGTAP